MKRSLLQIFLIVLFLVVYGVAQVCATSYTSTFDGSSDFTLTGFSDTNNAPPTPTNGPDVLGLDDPTGTYNLDIPPAGIYDWYLEVDNFDLDFNKDGNADYSLGSFGPVYLGQWQTPTPGLTGTYNFGNVYIPAINQGGIVVGGYTVNNLSAHWDITLSGTNITRIEVTVSGDNLSTINNNLTNLDNNFGGVDGNISGIVTAKFSITAKTPSAVPEPTSCVLLGLGLIGLISFKRKRS